QRANFACEYCGVKETEVASELTIDHFQPVTKAGTDDPENLVYCYHRCNHHKSDYWPEPPGGLFLWNPRREPAAQHFITAEDGILLPLTSVAEFTVSRLHLNREALVEHRRANIQKMTDEARLANLEEIVSVVPRLMNYLLTVEDENRQLKRLLIALMKKALQEEANEDEN
ncbi:MAG: HNH endonuclease, partial [Blastocatellia bacterium]